jgi:hypothetical protein
MKAVMGIDPGPEQTAYFVLNADETFKEWGKIPNADMYKVLLGRTCCEVACEKFESFGMAVGMTTFETVRWEGEYRCLCRQFGLAFHPVTRKQVKSHWCHTHRATDANIRQALLDYYGPQGNKANPGKTYGLKKDVWSALALAGYWRAQQT